MIEFFEEEQAKKLWEQAQSQEPMSLEQMVHLAKHGLGRCEERCLSVSQCGDDACLCVRTIFPTPEHYEIYKLARAFFLTALAKATFAAMIGEVIYGENNE